MRFTFTFTVYVPLVLPTARYVPCAARRHGGDHAADGLGIEPTSVEAEASAAAPQSMRVSVGAALVHSDERC